MRMNVSETSEREAWMNDTQYTHPIHWRLVRLSKTVTE